VHVKDIRSDTKNNGVSDRQSDANHDCHEPVKVRLAAMAYM